MSQEIILASSSKYRKKLLSRLKIPFTIETIDIDEKPRANEAPDVLVERLSKQKASTVARTNPTQWIIGSDQIALLDTTILGKPGNYITAYNQLKACSGKVLQFITGVSLINFEQNKIYYSSSTVEVKLITLTDEKINSYLNSDKPFDCAGSFKIESLGVALFEWVKSDDPTSLEGLPLITLCKLLRQAGIEPLDN